MLQTLLQDLSCHPALDLCTTRDSRLPPLAALKQYPVTPADDPWLLWEQLISEVDAVWPIAPESGGALLRLSRLVEVAGKLLLGSSADTVALTGSKSATVEALALHGIVAIPTCPASRLSLYSGPWVAKPDDGAGCDDTCYFDDAAALRHWLAQRDRTRTHVVQPYVAGTPMSLSLLCRAGMAWLLSCNRQQVDMRDGVFCYQGSEVNVAVDDRGSLQDLAQRVAKAIPGLAGYVGIDLILGDDGNLTVLEVNPRLTTSYVGLHRAIGVNPALLVVDLLYNQTPPDSIALAHNIVNVTLHD